MESRKRVKSKSVNIKALSASLWYMINTLLTKGLAIITTPIFSRMLTQEDYGKVNNFNSWLSILTIIASLNLFSSITRAKLDYEEDIDSFMSSVLVLSSISVVVMYAFALIFSKSMAKAMEMDIKLISYMFFYIVFCNAFNFIQTKHKSFLKYKSFTIISIFTVLFSVILSLILIPIMKEKYFARILGMTIPIIFVGIIMFINIIIKSKKIIKLHYWKYALSLSLPLILHVLSGNILTQFDRISIAKIDGFEQVALYGMAYNIASLLNIVWTSLNGSWVVWFYEKMKLGSYKEIRFVSKYYIKVFMYISILLLAFAPELMKIMAPSNYYEAIYVIPPIVLGLFFQFMYSFYINTELYYKKNMYIPIATVASAVINIVLNILLIPKYGYIAAAYTTLVGYICLFIFHYFLVKYLFSDTIFSIKLLVNNIIKFGIVALLYGLLYKYYLLRYLVTIFIIIFGIYTNRKSIKDGLNLIMKK